jgi:heme/copper-type cytochrome/quinol oxidase subunit 4
MQDFTKREIILGIVGFLAAVALTIFSVYAVIDRFVLNHDDPLIRAGGLKPSQQAK